MSISWLTGLDRVAASIGVPHPPYLGKVIRRSTGIWLLVRCMYVVALMVGVVPSNLLPLAEGTHRALQPDWATRAVLVALTTYLVWWDRKRSRELLLYANLGTHPAWFLGLSLLAASVLDIVVHTLLEVL